MPVTCAACRLPDDTKLSISCFKCKLDYHLLCVNLMPTDANIGWTCPSCHCKVRKGDNTPVRSTTSHDSGSSNITTRKKTITSLPLDSPVCESSCATMILAESSGTTLILAEIKLMRQDLQDLKLQLSVVTDNIAHCNKRLDDFELRLEASDERVRNIGNSQPDVAKLQETVSQLEEQLITQAQLTLRNELEIIGLPETPNENLQHIILVAAGKLGENLRDCDIDWVERTGPKPPQNRNQEGFRSRPVVVHFVRRALRDSVLRAVKARRNFSTSDMEIPGPSAKVYFNERLTKNGRILFREARQKAKQNGFRHCWTRNGVIHIRREEGRAAISIRNQADLDRHLALVANPM